MAKFKKGDKVRLINGNQIELLGKLGGGGQGTVYKVEYFGSEYALKWFDFAFLKNLANKQIQGKKLFKENIIRNITKGKPSDKFLWPMAITEEDEDGCFGYIMKLCPPGYYNFADIYNGEDVRGAPVAFKNFRAAVKSAMGIVGAFGALHANGYFYIDINDGNFFINIDDGDVLICDNDNVTAAPGYIFGKPGYIAPELARGDVGVKPSALTDAHSLAVMLFRLFIRHDPLMGSKHNPRECLSAEKEMELYGTEPVFVFDPVNTSNRPDPSIHTNPIMLWPIYPDYVHDAFIRGFCEGIKFPAMRLVEGEWGRIISRLYDDIFVCACGQEMLWSDGGGRCIEAICPSCGAPNIKQSICETERGYYMPDSIANPLAGTSKPEDPLAGISRPADPLAGISRPADPLAGISKPAKPCLAVFYVIDRSNSMSINGKINSVNHSIRETIPILKRVGGSDTDIKIAVLMFSDGAAWMYDKLIDVKDFHWNDIDTFGYTDFGAACNKLNDKLSEDMFMSPRAVYKKPVIILISDGEPTDEKIWPDALERLKNNKWFRLSIKIALAVDSANEEVLGKFVGSPEGVYKINEMHKLGKLIRIATVRASELCGRSVALDYGNGGGDGAGAGGWGGWGSGGAGAGGGSGDRGGGGAGAGGGSGGRGGDASWASEHGASSTSNDTNAWNRDDYIQTAVQRAIQDDIDNDLYSAIAGDDEEWED